MLNNATGFKHIYIATGYTDLRKSIDGLAMLISTEFKLNPYDEGSIFLFCGKRNDRIMLAPGDFDHYGTIKNDQSQLI